MNNKEWQPIETAPKDGSSFIALEDDEVFKMKFNGKEIVLSDSGCHYHEVHQWNGEFDYVKPKPTHWVLVPELPAV